MRSSETQPAISLTAPTRPENVRTRRAPKPRERRGRAGADARFELRLTSAQLAAWHAFAKERGQKLADTIRDALRALAGPEREAELGLATVDVEAIAAELRALRGGRRDGAP